MFWPVFLRPTSADSSSPSAPGARRRTTQAPKTRPGRRSPLRPAAGPFPEDGPMDPAGHRPVPAPPGAVSGANPATDRAVSWRWSPCSGRREYRPTPTSYSTAEFFHQRSPGLPELLGPAESRRLFIEEVCRINADAAFWCWHGRRRPSPATTSPAIVIMYFDPTTGPGRLPGLLRDYSTATGNTARRLRRDQHAGDRRDPRQGSGGAQEDEPRTSGDSTGAGPGASPGQAATTSSS